MTTDVNPVAELGQARQRVAELEAQAREETEREEAEAREQALVHCKRGMHSAIDGYHKARAELLPHLTALAALADQLVAYRQTMRRCSWRASKLDGDLEVQPPRLLGLDTKARHVLDEARRGLQAVGGV